MMDLERLLHPHQPSALAVLSRLVNISGSPQARADDSAGVRVNLRIAVGRGAMSARERAEHDTRLRRHRLRQRSQTAGRS